MSIIWWVLCCLSLSACHFFPLFIHIYVWFGAVGQSRSVTLNCTPYNIYEWNRCVSDSYGKSFIRFSALRAEQRHQSNYIIYLILWCKLCCIMNYICAIVGTSSQTPSVCPRISLALFHPLLCVRVLGDMLRFAHNEPELRWKLPTISMCTMAWAQRVLCNCSSSARPSALASASHRTIAHCNSRKYTKPCRMHITTGWLDIQMSGRRWGVSARQSANHISSTVGNC